MKSSVRRTVLLNESDGVRCGGFMGIVSGDSSQVSSVPRSMVVPAWFLDGDGLLCAYALCAIYLR